MGTDVYSTRKPTKEVLLMGITPVRVFTVQDAYRASGPYMGDPYRGQYNRVAAAADSRAHAASLYHEQMGHRFLVYGAFEEGNPVFEVEAGKAVPALTYSTDDPRGCKKIGYIFKVGGRWTIERECPGHRWNYKASRGDEPAKACTRCHRVEYVDAALQSEYEEKYPEAA